jgi:hypothetical protein
MIAVADPGSASGVRFVVKLRGGETVLANPAPSDWATAPYTVVDGVLVHALEVARAAQRDVINAGHEAALAEGIAVEIVEGEPWTFDADVASLARLGSAARSARDAIAAEAAWERTWTLADDTDVTLTAAQAVAADVAVDAAVNALHQRARVLKARIEAAETLAAVQAITWTLTDEG